MYKELGQLIKTAREALGMEQAELAGKLGVGQQAVSTWERGQSRPRRAMLSAVAEVVIIEEDRLLEVGGYLPAGKPKVSVPSRPLSRSLPLDELPPERFEDLLTEVMGALHPGGHASRFGGPGEKQSGIDILVTGDNGNLATGQCKRHMQFGPAAVAAAVAAVTIRAKRHHLFLSRLTATPGARKEIAKHKNWELWDGEDISRYIRNLRPGDLAVRLVDTYFPGHREAFLGVPQPGPWLMPEEVFHQSRSQIFNHDWSLAGRQTELDMLKGDLYGHSGKLAVLTGQGGLGKSRLLRALAEAAPRKDVQVRILLAGATVVAADFELLPDSGELVVLVDDAHERDDVSYVVAGIWRRNSETNILIASRPYGWNRLKADLGRAVLLPDSLRRIELTDLTQTEAEALAREALGGGHEGIVRRLARLTLDSPLATVVGGVLIRRGQLDASQLEQDEHVREHIMRGFRDALVADPLVADPDTRGAVLDGIAALQPFRTNESAFREALSAVVGKPYDVLSKHLRSLEDAGILRRRGTSLRIVPDLLGDVILAQAAYDDRDNIDTGYLARLQAAVDTEVAQHLFVNVSRVDWQVRRRVPGGPSLVDSLWTALEDELRAADVVGRQSLVKLLAKVAYFQPARALATCRWLIDNPTSEVSEEHAAWTLFGIPTYMEVLHELPPVLKMAGMNSETLGEALSQLWELAQGDARPTNQYPDHALRVLRDLAEFESGKPVEYNDMLIDIVSQWFADGLSLSPFDVLEPLLATEGSESSLKGYTISFQPFALRIAAVMPIRQRVIDLAFEEVTCNDLGRAAAGINALGTALRYPNGMYGRPVEREEQDRWTPGFVDTINRLGSVAASGSLDPALVVAIREALHWHGSYSPTDSNQAAVTALQVLPAGLEHRLALAVHDGWGRLILDPGDNYEVMESKRSQLLRDAVSDLSNLDDRDVVKLIVARLGAESRAFGPGSGHPGPLVAELVKARPSLAQGLLDRIVTGDAPALEPLMPVVLASFAEREPGAALTVARALLATGSPDQRRGVAQALSWNRGLRPLSGGELDLLLELAADPDPLIRRALIRAAQLLARDRAAVSSRLVAAVRFGDDSRLADEIFMCFGEQLGLSWENFTETELTLIRKDLVALKEIGEYSITGALARRSATDAAWVIELLQDRVSRAEAMESMGDYRPMPFRWDNQLRAREDAAFVAHLQKLLAWIAQGVDSWVRREMGSEIFKEVAAGYDKNVLVVLLEALKTGNTADVRAVAAVLRKANRAFIWSEADFVRTALHAGARHGENVKREMVGALWGATISGSRTGTPGQPFPEDVEQRDRSAATADQLPKGSLEEQFYRDMAASAEVSIARDAEVDVPNDGREW